MKRSECSLGIVIIFYGSESAWHLGVVEGDGVRKIESILKRESLVGFTTVYFSFIVDVIVTFRTYILYGYFAHYLAQLANNNYLIINRFVFIPTFKNRKDEALSTSFKETLLDY